MISLKKCNRILLLFWFDLKDSLLFITRHVILFIQMWLTASPLDELIFSVVSSNCNYLLMTMKMWNSMALPLTFGTTRWEYAQQFSAINLLTSSEMDFRWINAICHYFFLPLFRIVSWSIGLFCEYLFSWVSF